VGGDSSRERAKRFHGVFNRCLRPPTARGFRDGRDSARAARRTAVVAAEA